MNVTLLLDPDRFWLAGYICIVVCLNATMYLISAFYHKKFEQATPKLGFVLAIILSLLYAVSVFVSFGSGHTLGNVPSTLLILASAASMASSINLYLKMKKPRK
jgi:hypothetical protein